MDTMGKIETKNVQDSVIRIMLFLIIFLMLLWGVNHILMDKDSKKQMYALRYEPADTIDIIFLGNSHANNAFLPMELWESYGYTAYNFSMMAQTLPLVYYSAEDAIKMQHPKVLVVDLFAATSLDNNFPKVHRTVDNLTFKTRVKAIAEFIPKEKQMEYIFPLYLYHDRWNKLEIKDFLPFFLRFAPSRNARKGVCLVTDWKECKIPEKALNTVEMSELSEKELYWHERLKNLCEENNVQLLYAVVPYERPVASTQEVMVENMKLYNAIKRWCESNNVGYYNMFEKIAYMGLEFSTDFQDESHVNIRGAQKVTDCIAEYININYDIENRKIIGDALSDKWNQYYADYVVERDAAILRCKEAQVR